MFELIKVYSEINQEIISKKEKSINSYFIELTKILIQIQALLKQIYVNTSYKSNRNTQMIFQPE